MNSIKWIENKMPKTEDKELEIMALCNVKAARAFHESFPQYKVTPLAELKGSGSTPLRCSAAHSRWRATFQN